MSPRHIDSQGVIIEEGMRVAYNLSGDVVPGVVVDVSCASHVKIRLKGTRRYGHGPNHISRVRNARSILVLAGVCVENPRTGSTHWQRGSDAV